MADAAVAQASALLQSAWPSGSLIDWKAGTALAIGIIVGLLVLGMIGITFKRVIAPCCGIVVDEPLLTTDPRINGKGSRPAARGLPAARGGGSPPRPRGSPPRRY